MHHKPERLFLALLTIHRNALKGPMHCQNGEVNGSQIPELGDAEALQILHREKRLLKIPANNSQGTRFERHVCVMGDPI